jgi:hypothetical protein
MQVANLHRGSLNHLKKLFRIVGIAAAMIVLVFIGVWRVRAVERQKATDNFNLGLAHETGQGVAKDEAQAVTYYRDAAEHGNSDAQNNLGLMYKDGRGGLAKDDTQAVYWYRKAAAQGSKEAQDNLVMMYEDDGWERATPTMRRSMLATRVTNTWNVTVENQGDEITIRHQGMDEKTAHKIIDDIGTHAREAGLGRITFVRAGGTCQQYYITDAMNADGSYSCYSCGGFGNTHIRYVPCPTHTWVYDVPPA